MSRYRGDFLLTPPLPDRFTGPQTVRGEYWVYYHIDADRAVLYIGKTSQPAARTRQHEERSPWYEQIVTTVWFGPLDEVNAVTVERELIRAEQPPNNIQHTDRSPSAVSASPRGRLGVARNRVDRLRRELEYAERTAARYEAEVAASGASA